MGWWPPALCLQPLASALHAALAPQVDMEIQRLAIKLRQIMKVPKAQQVTAPGGLPLHGVVVACPSAPAPHLAQRSV